MIKLLFATNNRHKLFEIKKKLGGSFEILSLKELGFYDDIPEDFETLEENASQKSHFIHEKFKMDTIADDTGLEIDALDGAPGVYSARYAGENCSFDDNIDKVLKELKGIKNRKARFRTVISLLLNNTEYFFEGVVDGEILEERRGEDGFGYDPVFLPEGYDQSFSEMSIDLKNKISHRGRATEKLILFLKNYTK